MLKQFINDTQSWVWIIPISLGVWVVYQVISLWQLSALQFFSWSQVLSDTSIFLLPIIVLVILTYTNTKNLDEMVWYVCDKFSWITLLLIDILLVVLMYFASKHLIFTSSYPILLQSITIFSIPLWLIIRFRFNRIMSIKDNFEKLEEGLMMFISTFLLVTFIVVGINNSMYKDLYAIRWSQKIKITYMNDKYFFSSNQIYSRTDVDEFIHIK